MDSLEVIKTAVYDRLVGDTDLIELIPTIEDKIINVWAESEEPMPYIVYRVATSPAASLDVMGQATLTLDIFDSSPTQSRMWAIRARINKLFEGVIIETGNGHLRFRKALDVEIPEDDRYIWHVSSDWVIRYTRETEMSLLEA